MQRREVNRRSISAGEAAVVLYVIVFLLLFPGIASSSPASEQCRNHFLYGQYSLAEKPCIEAAEGGDLDAQNWLAFMYTKGKGVEQDMEKAFLWRSRSAKAGDANSQYNLGRLYQLGDGVTQDYQKARYWYSKAAMQGDVNGQYALGNLYSKALGVDSNLPLAHAWYSLAAGKGLALASQALENIEVSMTQDQLIEAQGLIEGLQRDMAEQ